jgi:hypothetical protein
MSNLIKYPLKSILKYHTWTFFKKSILYITLVLISHVSCSKQLEFGKTLPKPIKYSKIEFEPCAYANSPYICIQESNAIQLVLEFKQCQEQNKLLREINGN